MTSPVYVGGDSDAGGRDVVASSSGSAVDASNARLTELRGDTYQQGSTIGDLMPLPPVPGAGSKHEGDDSGQF